MSKSEKTHSKSKKMIVIKLLSSFFLKVLLGTREMHFWEHFHEFFAKSWIFSPRDRKRSNNYVSLQKNLQTFRWTHRLQFRHICQKIHANSWKILLNDQKAWANILPSKKMSSGHVVCSFDNPVKIILPKDGYICSETENSRIITLLSKKKPQNVPLET